MVIKMGTDKFYVIVNNEVTNVAIFKEEDAARLNLKRYPINVGYGSVDIGWTYVPKDDTFLPPPRNILEEWENVEQYKNALLQELMFWASPLNWETYTEEEKDKWREYRQKLVNIREGVLDPKDIVWPQKPIVEQTTYIKPSTPEV